MSVIPRRDVDTKTLKKLTLKISERSHATFCEYTAFLGETDNPSYVLEALIETVLAKDKAFVAWRDVAGRAAGWVKPAARIEHVG